MRLFARCVLVTLVLVACADHEPVAPPVTADDAAVHRQEARQPRLAGLDAEFANMAREISGFAGMFYDESGTLNVYVAERQARTAQARQALSQVLRDEVSRSMRARGREVPVDRMVIHDADYDFTELAAHSGRMLPVLGVPGVVFTDIDERANRLRIGIQAGTSEARVRHALQMLGVPVDVVNIEVTEPIFPLSGHSLQNRQQPMAGGLQLVMPHPTPGFITLCTLGFNVLRDEPGRSQHYFVTNSHCTGTQGTVTDHPFYQQSIAAPDPTYLIGIEVVDPAYFECGPGIVCRWSDAALVRYETRRTPVDLGAIYRTEAVGTGPNAGSLIVDQTGNPKTFTIVDDVPFPLGGEVLDKVGRTTGWTRGPVIGTCLNVLVAGTNIVLLCQDLVQATVAGGDSGSPVFRQHDDSRYVTLYGVLWGGGVGVMAFSALDNIRFELGDFRTH